MLFFPSAFWTLCEKWKASLTTSENLNLFSFLREILWARPMTGHSHCFFLWMSSELKKNAKCENFRNFLLVRFYVKSILEHSGYFANFKRDFHFIISANLCHFSKMKQSIIILDFKESLAGKFSNFHTVKLLQISFQHMLRAATIVFGKKFLVCMSES